MAPSSKLDLERDQRSFRDRDTKQFAPQPKRSQTPTFRNTTRHQQQQKGINEIKAEIFTSSLDQTLFDNRFREYDYEGRKLCLFNIIVALEWTPDIDDVATLRTAFDKASDRLYDLTDGYMAIDRVTVGDARLMRCADIQILASNRLFPRSSVDGLNEQEKYQPIRLGRGLWRKDDRTTFTWDTDLGFQTIAHEWLHYALGLKDQYLQIGDGLVTPTRNPAKETAMADVSITELTGDNTINAASKRIGSMYDPSRDDSEWRSISEHSSFQSLGIVPTQHPIEPPPNQVPYPIFQIVGTAKLDVPKLLFTLQGISSGSRAIDTDHCWVFIIKGADIIKPDELIAQGSYTDRPPTSAALDSSNSGSTSFPLLGAAVGDFVVLIGSEDNNPAQPLVLWSKIQGSDRGMADMSAWFDATPESFPIVDVTAKSDAATPPFSIELSGFDANKWEAITFPLGQQEQGRQLKKASTFVDGLQALDGHVMLISRAEPKRLAIASYSLGGSPSSAFPGHPNPIPAGSADGNAMIFFYDDREEPLRYEQYRRARGADAGGRTFDNFRVVTTTNLQNGELPPKGWEPRSYTFSITTNRSFWDVKNLNPTLVLYFDEKTLRDIEGELIIGRYNTKDNEWVQIDAQIKPGDFLAAASLISTTAPGLYDKTLAAEHYRLFLIKGDIS